MTARWGEPVRNLMARRSQLLVLVWTAMIVGTALGALRGAEIGELTGELEAARSSGAFAFVLEGQPECFRSASEGVTVGAFRRSEETLASAEFGLVERIVADPPTVGLVLAQPPTAGEVGVGALLAERNGWGDGVAVRFDDGSNRRGVVLGDGGVARRFGASLVVPATWVSDPDGCIVRFPGSTAGNLAVLASTLAGGDHTASRIGELDEDPRERAAESPAAWFWVPGAVVSLGAVLIVHLGRREHLLAYRIAGWSRPAMAELMVLEVALAMLPIAPAALVGLAVAAIIGQPVIGDWTPIVSDVLRVWCAVVASMCVAAPFLVPSRDVRL